MIIAKFYVSAPFTISFAARRFREIRESGINIIARSLGAKISHIITKVLLTLSARDMVTEFSLTWARAMGELATIPYQGRIIQHGRPDEILERPINDVVKRLIAPMYMLWNKNLSSKSQEDATN